MTMSMTNHWATTQDNDDDDEELEDTNRKSEYEITYIQK